MQQFGSSQKNYRENFDQRLSSATVRRAVTLSDTNEFQFNSYSHPDEDLSDDRYCRGFHANASGTLRVTDPRPSRTDAEGGGYYESQHAVDIYVNKGSEYHQAVGKFMSAGTDAALHAASMIIAYR